MLLSLRPSYVEFGCVSLLHINDGFGDVEACQPGADATASGVWVQVGLEGWRCQVRTRRWGEELHMHPPILSYTQKRAPQARLDLYIGVACSYVPLRGHVVGL